MSWPVASIIIVAILSLTGLIGWRLYLDARYTDEPED